MSRRMTSMVMLFGLGLTACGDNLEPAPEVLTETQQLWVDQAQPVLQMMCTSCHSQVHLGVAFLAGSDDDEVRETLLASGVVDVDMPATSPLLTKGVHQGPYLTREQAAAIIRWLEAERAGL